MPRPSIELIRYEPTCTPESPRHIGSYMLVVKAKAKMMPSEIFVYHAIGDANPYSGDPFEAVANPRQMEEVPVNKPYTDPLGQESVPYYRRNQLELYFLSLAELDDFWNELKMEVTLLVDNFKRFEDLQNTRVLNFDGSQIHETDALTQPSALITLYSEPSTSVELDNGEIVRPDKKQFGWLPVDKKDKNAPEKAKLKYNLEKHYSLLTAWNKGIREPYELHSLEINGFNYSGGNNGIYEVNKDGIYWLDFNPEDFADDPKNRPRPSKNPWPDDYFLGYGSSDPNIIKLLLYLK